MLILTDEQALNLWLDEHPGDLVARSVLADWLEENARDDEAEGQRWLIAEEKWPTHNVGFRLTDYARLWDWWGELDNEGDIVEGPEHAQMPPAFWEMFYDQNMGRYKTRCAAEADAIAYARRNGLLGKPLSRTAERR